MAHTQLCDEQQDAQEFIQQPLSQCEHVNHVIHIIAISQHPLLYHCL